MMPTQEQFDDALPTPKMGNAPQRWAAEFNHCAAKLGYSSMDEDWLIGWFARAIETGYEAAGAQADRGSRDNRVIWNEALVTAQRSIKALRR